MSRKPRKRPWTRTTSKDKTIMNNGGSKAPAIVHYERNLFSGLFLSNISQMLQQYFDADTDQDYPARDLGLGLVAQAELMADIYTED